MIKRIVMVEDDQAIMDAFQMAFKTTFNIAEYELVQFENGKKIIEHEIIAPNLFILDRHISGTDGLDVCRFIKNSNLYKHVPIIMLSANPNINTLAQDAGADDTITKPFPLKKLQETVLKYINIA